MARTAITPRALVRNGNLTGATGATTVDATLVTNGVVIANARPEQMLIRTTHTDGTAHDIIIRSGDSPPSLRAGQGDLTLEVAATTGVQYLGPFESDKYLQDDGSMHIDFETGYVGTIDVLTIPKV
jgi:hypothetical protein